MPTVAAEQYKWRKRLLWLTITSVLMVFSFAVGVAITVYISCLLILPIAATVGMASASAHAMTSALYTGDSATRMTVLTQLQQTFDAQPNMTFDAQTVAIILPAIEACKTDSDVEVVALADELASDIKCKTTQAPQ